MKVVLFGATGKTGRFLIEEAVARGIDTTVVARSSSVFADERVKVVSGDLTDIAFLRSAVQGAHAVLSALGPTVVPHPKGTPITRAMQSIISAMKQEEIRRLIAVSTGTAPDPADKFDWKINLPARMIKYLMRSAFDDIQGLAQTVRASGLDWTLVRAALLKDRDASPVLNIGLYGHTRHSLTVSRRDLAHFMFDQIEDQTYVGHAPGISTG